MKSFSRCLGFAAGVALCLAGTAGAFAAVVDKTAPYEGEYFIAYNDYIRSSQYFSGLLPTSLSGEEDGTESAGAAEFDVMDIRETEDGETIYRLEPRDLEDRIAPPAASPRRAAPARQGRPAQLGDEREFITVNVETNESSHTPFVLKYAGEYCNLWLERDDARGITDEMAAELGMEYDVKIHGRMLAAYGPTYDRDGDGKLAILLYDIQDGFSGYGGYVGGFFMPADLGGEKFNCMDVIHIDTWPSIDISKPDPLAEIKSTMVHELQHLIEFSYCMEKNRPELPIWINEGLSMAAEHIIYGALEGRIRYYNEEAYWNTPLADWLNDADQSLSNYAYSYLFFQYLRTQTKNFTGGGEELFRYILQSERRSALAVEEGMKQFYPYISIGDIFRNFHIALTLNEPTGLYGFAGEPEFDAVQPKLYPDSDEYVILGNGAAAVKRMESESYTPEEEGAISNLRYAAFSPGGDSVDAPKANVSSGEIYSYKTVALSCAERYATMYYTLDGSEPNENSLIYDGEPIRLFSDTTLKAITVTSDGRKSDIVSYHYTIAREDVDLFRRTIGSYYDVTAYDCVAAPDGTGIVVVGSVTYDALGWEDFFDVEYNNGVHTGTYCVGYIVKYGYDGQEQWMRTLGDSDIDLYGITVVEDGYVVVGSYITGENEHRDDLEGLPMGEPISDPDSSNRLLWSGAVLAKYDFDGNRKWVTTIPTPGTVSPSMGTYFYRITSCSDGGFLCAGIALCDYTSSMSYRAVYPEHVGRAVLIKTDAAGSVLWRSEISGDGIDCFRDACTLKDGTIIAVGYMGGNSFGTGDWSDVFCSEEDKEKHADAVIVAYTEQGDILWKKTFCTGGSQGVFEEYFFNVLPLEDGGFAAAGGQRRNLGATRGLLACFDADGTLRWSKVLNNGGSAGQYPHQYFSGIASADDGIMAEVSFMYGNIPFQGDLDGLPQIGYRDSVAVKYDLDGELVWKKSYNSNFLVDYQDIEAFSLTQIGDRQYAVCGENRIMGAPEDVNIPPHAFLFTFYDESTPHYTVSGNVGLPGVSIGGKLSDSQGNYTVKVMEGESAVLTPTLAGYTFSPKSRTVGPMTAPVDGVDFTPRERVYTFKGRVLDKDGSPLAGVTVAKGVVTGEDGTYVLKARPGSTVLLEPRLEGKSFEPASITRTAVTGGERGLDFRVLKPMYTVSGKVTRNGAGQGGVEVFRNVLTGPDGTYSFTVEEGTKVSLAPGFQKYRFEPAVASLGAVTEDREQDFAMLPLPFLLRASPLRVSFDPVVEGEAFPQAVTVTVRNLEGDPCTGLVVFQEEDSDFEVSSLSGDTVSVGDGGATFTVKPKVDLARGEYTATVQLRQGETVVLTVPVTFRVEEVKPPEEPDPEEPDPEEPDPDEPDPDKPDPDKPDPDKPDPDKPDPDKPDPDNPDPDKPDPDKPDPEEPDDPKPSTPSTGGGSGGGHSVAPPKGETPTQATHAAYLQGYPDGCFHPDDTLTRAQCAAMLSRLDPAFDPERVTVSLPFSDTGAERWFAPYLSFCHHKGLVRGYPDGTFRPDGAMTRGEFASVVRNALALESAGEEFFPDTETHWARYPIAQLVQAGILDGYPDGTFRPDEPITRAEAAKVLNRVWQRPGTEGHLAEVPAPEYPDLPQSHWAYWEIWEASVSHPAEKK